MQYVILEEILKAMAEALEYESKLDINADDREE